MPALDKFDKLARMASARPSTPLPDVPKLDPDFLLGTPEERHAAIAKLNEDWERFFKEQRQVG